MEVLTFWDAWGELIRSILVAISTVAVAYVGKMEKVRKQDVEKALSDAKIAEEHRKKEKRLELAMQSANSKLTVGIAMALKHGHCNGEVEAGLEAMKSADEAYRAYLQGMGIDRIIEQYKI